MKHFIPTNRLPSAHAKVEDSGQIKPTKRNGWESQKNLPTQVALNIDNERRARAARGLHT
jgi:hypothetical protein